MNTFVTSAIGSSLRRVPYVAAARCFLNALFLLASLLAQTAPVVAQSFSTEVMGQVFPANAGEPNYYYNVAQGPGVASTSLDSGMLNGIVLSGQSGQVTGSADLAKGSLRASTSGNTFMIAAPDLYESLTFHLPPGLQSTVVGITMKVTGTTTDVSKLGNTVLNLNFGNGSTRVSGWDVPNILDQTLSRQLTVSDGDTVTVSAFLVLRADVFANTLFSAQALGQLSMQLEPGVTFTSQSGVFLKQANALTIDTLAGNGIAEFSGDGSVATAAGLDMPFGVAADRQGNVYIADTYNHRIRKIDNAGVITTAAGTGATTFSGDGGAGPQAGLQYPTGVAVDTAGNVYIADSYNARIRRLDAATGVISTVAGGGSAANLGDGGAATGASLAYPAAVAVDPAGNLYIADQYHNRVRKVTAAGTITTIAGNGTEGFGGDGGPAIDASLYYPTGVAVDSAGNVFVADQYNNRVRKISASTGSITTVAGTGTPGFNGDGGAAVDATLYRPTGVVVDADGNLYIADQYNHRIRKVTSAGQISTAAGSGTPGFSGDGGPATDAKLYTPIGVTLDPNGSLYIADSGNQRIRKVGGVARASDMTAPVITSSVQGSQGTNGWYTGNVSVSWSVTDPESQIDSSTGCSTASITADTTGDSLTCAATSAGGTSSDSVTIKRDTVAPTAIATPAPLPNSDGFNNTDVTVTFTGTDPSPGSGIATCTAPAQLTTEGLHSGVQGFCTDNAGHDSNNAVAPNIRIDKTAPTVTASRSPAANAAGWNRGTVTVSYTATDSLSGVPVGGCDAPTYLSSDAAGQTATGHCHDLAGNSGSATISGINIDTTRPVATVGVSPGPNADGWNNTNVVVSFSGTDSLSGSGIATCTAPITVSLEGLTFGTQGFCTDVAGNDSNAAIAPNIRIDRTAPSIAIPVPAAGATYYQGSSVTANYNCSDSLSGLASCIGPVANGAAIDTTSTGGKSLTVNAADRAGNTRSVTNTYTIATPPPVIQPVSTGTLGDNGWYRSNVSLSWQLTSPYSAIATTSGCKSTSVNKDTTGTTYTCSATNAGGTATQSVTVKRDATAPAVTITTPKNKASYTRGSTVLANYSCSDTTAGIVPSQGCAGTVAIGAAIDTAATGAKSFTVNARDQAGNATSTTVSYTVK